MMNRRCHTALMLRNCAAVLAIALGSAAMGGEFAVEFDGQKDHIEVDKFRYDGSYPVTIEAFAQPLSDKKGSVFVDFEAAGIGLHSREGRWLFNVFDNAVGMGTYRFAISDLPADKEKIAHIAGVFDEQTVVLYVDGHRQKRQGTMLATVKPSGLPFFIGANPGPDGAVQERFHGRIDAVRLSKGVLYTKDFKPPLKLQKDAATLVLINLEEGQDDLAKDESGKGHHGTMHGGKWVKLTRSVSEGERSK
ncbi:MAG: LamG domain-containing protein [Planctomycetaceae bacterium]|nr:LamG domain-containing protein [Planctomycetaceae bacterium]